MQILPDALGDLEESLHFRAARQGVLAGNLANVDTPHYRSRDIEFDNVLGHEQLRLSRTSRQHLADEVLGRAFHVKLGPKGEGPDGNGVALDDELVRMSRNAGAYQDEADILSRLMGLVRSAISGEG